MALELVVTNIGLNKLATASATNPLAIKDFALGDSGGIVITPSPSATSLTNEQIRLPVNSVGSFENEVTVKCLLPLNAPVATGFTTREIGLFDEDNELIAIGQTSEEYIPALDEGIPTENIYTIIFTFENAGASIVVAINPDIYALQSDLEALNTRVMALEVNKTELNNALIGFIEWQNKDQTYKDQLIVTKGIFTWALLDESNILSIAEYPILYANSNASEILDGEGNGTGNFTPRGLKDGTIRHLVAGDTGRLLGTYQEDAMQKITGTVSKDAGSGADGPFSWNPSGASKDGGPTTFGTITFDNSRVARTADETRMKNTAVQIYVLAKIN